MGRQINADDTVLNWFLTLNVVCWLVCMDKYRLIKLSLLIIYIYFMILKKWIPPVQGVPSFSANVSWVWLQLPLQSSKLIQAFRNQEMWQIHDQSFVISL